MKSSIFAIILIISAFVNSVAQSSQPVLEDGGARYSELPGVGIPVIEPRDLGQVCPPVFDSMKEVMQRYLDGRLVQVIQPDELALAFDLPILTIADLEPLTDKNDVEICKELNEHLGHLFHEAVNVPGDSGLEPKHFYEITYYQADSQGMYIAVISGLPVVWRHKPTKTSGFAKPPGPGTSVRFFDMNVQPIHFMDVRSRVRALGDD